MNWIKKIVGSATKNTLLQLDRGAVDIGKNYKYLFHYLPAEKENEFSNLLYFSSLDKITQSLFATMQLFHREAQRLAQKLGFDYDKEVAEKMIQYAEERLEKNETFTK